MNFDLSYGCPTARPSYDKSKFLPKSESFRNKNFAKFAGDLILGPTLSGATQINAYTNKHFHHMYAMITTQTLAAPGTEDNASVYEMVEFDGYDAECDSSRRIVVGV